MASSRRTSRPLAPAAALLAGALLLGATGLAVRRAISPPRRQSTGDLRLHELGNGLYVYRGLVSNSGVLVLRSGVLVVDTQVSPLAARALRERIRERTALPVRWVVNTHHHLDHCGGNALFAAEGAEIFAGEDTRQVLAERPREAAEYARDFSLPLAAPPQPCTPPTRAFTGSFTLALDGEEVQLLHLGATETPDGIAVWAPRLRAFFAGDAVSGADYPSLGVPTSDDGLHDDGAWTGFLAAALERKPRVLVPGHGDAFDDEGDAARRLQQLYDLFEILLAVSRREVSRGTSFPALLARVGEHVGGFRRRDGFDEVWAGQDQAVLRAWNSVLRRGRGYWQDFGPRALPRPDPARLRGETEASAADPARAIARAFSPGLRDRAVGLGLLEAALAKLPAGAPRARLLGARGALCLLAVRERRPLQEGAPELAEAQRAADEALAEDPREPLALFARGGARLLGALAFGQPTDAARELLREAVASGAGSPPIPEAVGRAAHALLLEAAFVAGETAAEEAELRPSLPSRWRWAAPLLRRKLESFP